MTQKHQIGWTAVAIAGAFVLLYVKAVHGQVLNWDDRIWVGDTICTGSA